MSERRPNLVLHVRAAEPAEEFKIAAALPFALEDLEGVT